MPELPHIFLPRVELEVPRRRGGFGRPPARDYREHGPALQEQVEGALRTFAARPQPEGIDPTLILRIQLHPGAVVDEETWERCGLTLLSVEQDKTLALFSSDHELVEFRRRLRDYQTGPRAPDEGAPYNSVFASIDRIGDFEPKDRLGRLLRANGIENLINFRDDQQYVLDVELWDLGGRDRNRETVTQIENFIRARGGRATDRYIGEALVLIRIAASGAAVRGLLNIDVVAQVDLPPRPSLAVSEMLRRRVPDFPPVDEPGANAPPIAILDSGLTSAHPLLAPAVGEATAVPLALGGAADDHGHGTLVAGIALYGDVEACIESGVFAPALRLYSARVLNENNVFDDRSLITTQMRDAIRHFSEAYACRVFNLSLGDVNLPYRGGKVSPWASILDTLARELDVNSGVLWQFYLSTQPRRIPRCARE